MSMKKRILIAGGFGYLGGRVAQFLASQPEYEVVLGSRRQTESPPWLPQAEVIQTRWESEAELSNACNGIDAVVQLSGMNAQDCAANPVAALEVNAVATARLLKVAVGKRVKRFIYVSTAHVYGSPLVGVISEETRPVNLHPYATSHRAGEDVVLAAQQRGVIEGIVIRLSNGYGAPAHKDANCWMLLINDLCRQAVVSGKLVLRSAGQQRRDFVTLTDACRATAHLLSLPSAMLGNGMFNVGEGWTSTVYEVASLVADRCEDLLGYRPDIIQPDPEDGEISQPLDYCIDRLRGTGFELQGNRNAEIDATLKFCRKVFSV